jgi:hypothetical protein
MERIRLYRISTFLSWTLIVIACLNAAFGIALLIKNMEQGYASEDSFKIVHPVFMILQGIVFLIWGIYNLRKRKFYIEWDETELRLFLPDTKKIEKVKFSDIQSVIIRLFEIELKLPDKCRIIDLNNLEYEDLKKVKKKFEKIQ